MKIKIYITSLMLFALGINLIFGQDIHEPNDTYETATPVTCGQQLTAYIQVEGDVDWYEIEMAESGVLEVAVTSVPDDLRLNLEIYQLIDNVLTGIADDRGTAGLGSNRFSNAVVNPGIYLVAVYIDFGTSFNDTDPYEMAFTCTPNALELNQIYEEAAPIALDTCFEANLYGDNHLYTVTYDADWFEVEVSSSGVLEVAVTSVPDDLRLDVWIFQIIDNVVTPIADDRGTAGQGSNRFSNAVVNPGTYLIYVGIDFGVNYNEETYSFCSNFTANALELNQIYEEAAPIALDTCFEANIYGDNHLYTVTYDADWFEVEVMSTGVLEVAVTSVPDDLRLDIAVFQIIDNVVTLIADDRGTAGQGSNRFSNAVVNPGTYLIYVGIDFGVNYNEETYSFCSNFTPNALELNQTYEEASPIALDTCFEDNIYGDNHLYSVTYDEDWFELEVPQDNYPLEIAITSVPDDLRLNLEVYQLIDNSLTLIADDGGSAGSGANRFVSAIVDAGTYLIYVGIDFGVNYNEDTYNFCMSFMDIDENALANQFEVYPNPNTGHFSLSLQSGNNDIEVLDVSIYNHLGQECKQYSENLNSGGHNSYSIQNSAKGIYIMRIRTNKGVVTKKLLVK